MAPGRRRRSALDLGESQVGEFTTRDSAGENIVHQGADFGEVLAFLKDYTFTSDQTRETAIKEVRAELTALRAQMEKRERYTGDEARIASEAFTSLRGQVDRIADRVQRIADDEATAKKERERQQAEERDERERRQKERDATDAQIARGLYAVRRRLLWQQVITGVVVATLIYVAFYGWNPLFGLGVLLAGELAARMGR